MDDLLGGGIPTGYIVEVTGERYVADLDLCVGWPVGSDVCT
jgi:RecA/RadA recombinase